MPLGMQPLVAVGNLPIGLLKSFLANREIGVPGIRHLLTGDWPIEESYANQEIGVPGIRHLLTGDWPVEELSCQSGDWRSRD